MYNNFDDDMIEQQEAELLQKALTLEAANAPPDIETDTTAEVETTQKKQLKRDIKAAALERLVQAAKTPEDFKAVLDWWDKRDSNRERRERCKEISRGDNIPLDYGAADGGMFFPRSLNKSIARQISKGDFIDAIYNCPYEIHELVTEEYLYKILRDLKDEHKELLYLIAIKGLSNTQIAKLQGKTDRAVRYMRETLFKKIRRKAYDYLTSEQGRKHDLTLAEKRFIENYDKTE